MTERQLAQALEDLAWELSSVDETEIPETATLFRDSSIRSFEEAGLLTSNAGVVITLPTGEEFQVTIVRSR